MSKKWTYSKGAMLDGDDLDGGDDGYGDDYPDGYSYDDFDKSVEDSDDDDFIIQATKKPTKNKKAAKKGKPNITIPKSTPVSSAAVSSSAKNEPSLDEIRKMMSEETESSASLANVNDIENVIKRATSMSIPSPGPASSIASKLRLSLPSTPIVGTPKTTPPMTPMTPQVPLPTFKDPIKYTSEIPDSVPKTVSIMTCGHIDGGKSTLVGRLLCDTNAVKMSRKSHSALSNVSSTENIFSLVLDSDSMEKERGVTEDVNYQYFCNSGNVVLVKDAPGHRDFVLRLVRNAFATDVGIIVVACTPGEAESGLSPEGQTREHALLLQSLSIDKIIIAMTKLDSPLVNWSQNRIEDVKNKVTKLLINEYNFNRNNIVFCECSGMSGEGIVSKREVKTPYLTYQPDTLVDVIDSMTAKAMSQTNIQKRAEKPLMAYVFECFKADKGAIQKKQQELMGLLSDGSVSLPQLKGVVVTCRIEQGVLYSGMELIHMPSATILKIGNISRMEPSDGAKPVPIMKMCEIVYPGMICDLEVTVDQVKSVFSKAITTQLLPAVVMAGTLLLNAGYPSSAITLRPDVPRSPWIPPITSLIEIRAITLKLPSPILPGSSIDVCVGNISCEALILQILWEDIVGSKSKKRLRRRRFAKSNETSLFDLQLDRGVMAGVYMEWPKLSRVSLRLGGMTVAIGRIEKLKETR